ncbi:flagellar brake protein [Pseudoalteromonas sp. S16_S37]|uniref:flagellar brake protein n=1 Tax=Pseudoalteromonas sp. S16_S37 TaxID=2720228 RepID=UPI001681B58F|nr:flagellar brake protein [Pseudoalteromonas sp. S16_S37]MBD1581886.1 flagellar brake protein [Pseudoalteromonas sp. S16_S37]
MFKSKSSSGYQKIELISVGSVIDLEILMAANSKRVKTEFIGYLEGQYIILNYPKQKQLGAAAEHVKEGATVIVRAVADHSDGQIIAFKTDIKAVAYTPTKLIFLYPPQQVQSQCLRHHVRIPTLIPATLMTQRSSCEGVIKDLSRTGLLFSMPESVVDLPVHDKSCHIVVADRNKQQISLSGEVCSTTHQDDTTLIGIRLIADEGKVDDILQQCLIDLSALHAT